MGSAVSAANKHKSEVSVTLNELISKVVVYQNSSNGEVIMLLEEDVADFLRSSKEEWYLATPSSQQYDYNKARLSSLKLTLKRDTDISIEDMHIAQSSGSSKMKAKDKFESLKEKKNQESLKRRNDRASPNEPSISYSIFANSNNSSPLLPPRSKFEDVVSPSERLFKEETRLQASRVLQKLDEQERRKERMKLTISKQALESDVAFESSKLSPYVFASGKSPARSFEEESTLLHTPVSYAVRDYMDKKRSNGF